MRTYHFLGLHCMWEEAMTSSARVRPSYDTSFCWKVES